MPRLRLPPTRLLFCVAALATSQPSAPSAPTAAVVASLRQRRCTFEVWDVAEQGPLPLAEFQRRYPAGSPRRPDPAAATAGGACRSSKRKAARPAPLLVRGGGSTLAAVSSGAGQWTATHLAAVAGGVKMQALEHTKDTAHGLYHYAWGGPTREVTLSEFLATKGRNATGFGIVYTKMTIVR